MSVGHEGNKVGDYPEGRNRSHFWEAMAAIAAVAGVLVAVYAATANGNSPQGVANRTGTPSATATAQHTSAGPSPILPVSARFISPASWADGAKVASSSGCASPVTFTSQSDPAPDRKFAIVIAALDGGRAPDAWWVQDDSSRVPGTNDWRLSRVAIGDKNDHDGKRFQIDIYSVPASVNVGPRNTAPPAGWQPLLSRGPLTVIRTGAYTACT